MPGWQDFYAKHRDKLSIISVAVDTQGTEVVRPWHEAAKAEFVTFVDQQNILGNLYNLKAIPYGIMIDEFGRLAKEPFSINVENVETISLLEKWISDAIYNEMLVHEAGPFRKIANPKVAEADARFQLGLVLLKIGKKKEAIAEW